MTTSAAMTNEKNIATERSNANTSAYAFSRSERFVAAASACTSCFTSLTTEPRRSPGPIASPAASRRACSASASARCLPSLMVSFASCTVRSTAASTSPTARPIVSFSPMPYTFPDPKVPKRARTQPRARWSLCFAAVERGDGAVTQPPAPSRFHLESDDPLDDIVRPHAARTRVLRAFEASATPVVVVVSHIVATRAANQLFKSHGDPPPAAPASSSGECITSIS